MLYVLPFHISLNATFIWRTVGWLYIYWLFFLFDLLVSGKLYKTGISTEKNKESRFTSCETAFLSVFNV